MEIRFEKFYHTMATADLEAFVVTDKINRRYLCGFTGSNGLLVVTPGKNTLIIDGRYTEQASKQTQNVAIYTLKVGESYWGVAARLLEKFKKIGFEEDSLCFRDYQALKQKLAISVELIPTSHLIERLRMIKTSAELTKIRQAAMLADQTFSHVLTLIKPGMTELALANEIDYLSKKYRSDGPAFETIVASGTRTALPHAHATHKKIEQDELIMLDFGCTVEGYYSDLTRTFALGEVSATIKNSYQLLLKTQCHALAMVEVGCSVSELDLAARNYLAKSDQAKYFTHGLGHGIGLACHEYPSINQIDDTRLQPQMVFTVEPGIYYPGQYGIRIEDDVYLDEQGKVEILTKSKKEWMNI